MAFLAARLGIIGPEVTVQATHRILSLRFFDQPKRVVADGDFDCYATLTILEEELEEHDGVYRTIRWIEENETKLKELDAKKTLDIECHLQRNEGSRFLRIPVGGLEILSDLDCSLRFQYMQESLRL